MRKVWFRHSKFWRSRFVRGFRWSLAEGQKYSRVFYMAVWRIGCLGTRKGVPTVSRLTAWDVSCNSRKRSLTLGHCWGISSPIRTLFPGEESKVSWLFRFVKIQCWKIAIQRKQTDLQYSCPLQMPGLWRLPLRDQCSFYKQPSIS